MQGLDALSLPQRFELDLAEAGRRSLRPDRFDHAVYVFAVQPVRDEQHEREVPRGFVPGTRERRHVIGPPQPFGSGTA